MFLSRNILFIISRCWREERGGTKARSVQMSPSFCRVIASITLLPGEKAGEVKQTGSAEWGASYFSFFMCPEPAQLPGNYVYPRYNMRSQAFQMD